MSIFVHMLLNQQAVQEVGAKLIEDSDINTADITDRLKQLAESWEELKEMTANRYWGL